MDYLVNVRAKPHHLSKRLVVLNMNLRITSYCCERKLWYTSLLFLFLYIYPSMLRCTLGTNEKLQNGKFTLL